MTALRNLPSIDHVLQSDIGRALRQGYGHDLTRAAARQILESIRRDFSVGDTIPIEDDLRNDIARLLQQWTRPTLVRVINATGVIIHTNLGRSPLSQAAQTEMQAVSAGYSNLEFDLPSGKRGSRSSHAEALIRRLTGAEAAFVVNNNAAAVMLVLGALARRRRVAISRTQLIEIGGGFRIPDVMKQSGAILAEIGTTNRVHLYDYERAIAEQPIALILTVHRSNFSLSGFTSEPTRQEIAAVASQAGLPYVEDLGSGTLLETTPYGLEHEPTVQETLSAGVDLVTFSGDKLLGGPQAGIIAGSAELVAKCKKHPFARAIRPDKTTYAALSATLTHYLKGEALTQIPIWRMISATPADLARRSQAWLDSLLAKGVSAEKARLIPGDSTVGGGSLPGQTLPSQLLALRPKSSRQFLAALRDGIWKIVARAHEDQVLFDPRTVLPDQDPELLEMLYAQLELL